MLNERSGYSKQADLFLMLLSGHLKSCIATTGNTILKVKFLHLL